MEDKETKLTLHNESPPAGSGGSLAERRKIGGSKLHQRVAAAAPLDIAARQAVAQQSTTSVAQAPKAPNPFDASLEMPNRIGMMLDCSSSMNEDADYGGRYQRASGKSKMKHLKDACLDFLQNCDFSTTSIAIETFPEPDEDDDYYRPQDDPNDPLAHLLPPGQQRSRLRGARGRSGAKRGLCNIHAFLQADIDALEANGGTPMAPAMECSITKNSLTRGILVSDGEADNPGTARSVAQQMYKDAGVAIDCVHIGRSTGGEELLKEIAEITGGLYIKFDSVENFTKAFKFLTPAYRAMLTSGPAGMLGAKEVK